MKEADYLFEPCYNQAIQYYKLNDYQETFKYAKRALEIYPDHVESKELLQKVDDTLRVF